MNNHSTAASNVIPFRKAKLLLIEHDGQPYVPMKPVVEGMGLAWAAQTVKLNSNKGRWGVSIIETPSASGVQSYLCIPLKKLFGWLMTLHPTKVREDIRVEIQAYQNECDDALWAYWNDGMAVRNHGRDAMTVIGELIGMTELNVIKGLIRDKSKAVPTAMQQSFALTMHNRLHTRFNVPRTELIPAGQFEAACNFIGAYALEGEWLGKEPKRQPNLEYPLASLVARRQSMLTVRNATQAWLDVTLHDLRDIHGESTPLENLLYELRASGFDVDGCWWELRTYRNKVRELISFATGMNRVIEDPHRYAVKA